MNKINKMKKKFIFLAAVLFLFIVPYISSSSVSSLKVDSQIFEKLNDEQEVSVIVMLKDGPVSSPKGLSVLGKPGKTILEQKKAMIKKQQDNVLSRLKLKSDNAKGLFSPSSSNIEFSLRHKYSTVNGFSGRITNSGLEKLMNDPNVKRIYLNSVKHTLLDVSVPQINGDDVWNLKLNNINITGKDETVCVIDTGIDNSHSAFTGRILNQYCYCDITNYGSGGCCPDNTTEDTSAEDDNGHGTHCAGIAAGNHSTYKGVAPEAGIISIKVCNSTGDCSNSDLIAGIDWCVNNATTYNISVISISLGGGGPYNDYCNGDVFAPAINFAVGQNISVIVASGNDAYTTGISSPACVQNATPVGSVDDGSGGTTADDISSFTNRGNILNLMAPGRWITAPYFGGGTNILQGTSMSAPHVAGAAALLKQFVRLQDGTDITPQEIEDVLNDTGVQVYDGATGRYYSRIDVYAAIISLDTTAPTVTVTLSDPTPTKAGNVTFTLDFNEAMNQTQAPTVKFNDSSVIEIEWQSSTQWTGWYNFTTETEGNYTINVTTAKDVVGNTMVEDTSNWFVLDTTPPQYSDAGKNDTSIKVNDVVLFYANWSDTDGLSHYIFSWNHSGSWVNDSAESLTDWSNITKTITATGKPQIDWIIYANDSANNWNNTGIQTFTVNNTTPTITNNVTSPATVYTNTNFNLNLTITDIDNDNLTAYVQFYVNNTANGSVQSQPATNGKNTLIGILGSGNFSRDYNLTAEFWAGDGTENTTKENTTTITVNNSIPTQPSLTNPANESIQTTVNVTINWSASTDADNNTINYFIHFLNISSPSYNSSTQDLYKNFTDLTDNETYYWYIIANDGTENSTASEQRQFTINTTALTVTFVPPTPEHNVRQIKNYIYVNVTVTHSSLNISNCTLLWNNGTNSNISMEKVGTGTSVFCRINITTTDGINYTYNVIANTSDGVESTTGNRTNLENTKPTLTSNPEINNSNPKTNDILICNAGTFDDTDGDSLNGSQWRWYANNVLNATTQILNLTHEGLDKGIILKCSQRVADSYEWSSNWYNSTNITVQNTAPTQPSLNSPTNGATSQLLAVTQNITITDIDGDNMNVSFYDSSNDLLLGTNNNLSNGSYAVYEWSGLSYSTTYKWHVNITDGINTSQSQNWSFTTKTEPTTSGGGGGGTPTITYEQESLGTLAAGSGKTVTFSKSETLAVTEITVTVKNSVTNAKIKVDVSSLPSGAYVPSSAGGSVYKYIEITKTAMADDDVEKATIKFKVKRSWLIDKSYGKDTIALYRYYNNKWNKLTTTRNSQDTIHYYYSAESPGFSTFAITAEATTKTTETEATIKEVLKEEESEAEENVTTEETPVEAPPKEEKEAKSNTDLIITLIAVIMAIVIVSYFVHEKKQKKKRKRKR